MVMLCEKPSPNLRSQYFFFLAIAFLVWPQPVLGQITSDGSLSTLVSTSDRRNFTINNGNRVGGNLFCQLSGIFHPYWGVGAFQDSLEERRDRL